MSAYIKFCQIFSYYYQDQRVFYNMRVVTPLNLDIHRISPRKKFPPHKCPSVCNPWVSYIFIEVRKVVGKQRPGTAYLQFLGFNWIYKMKASYAFALPKVHYGKTVFEYLCNIETNIIHAWLRVRYCYYVPLKVGCEAWFLNIAT